MNSIPPTGQPGLWIRVQHRFGPRMPEWFLAGHTALWGYVLLFQDRVFDQPAFSFFREIFRDEQILGWTMVILGLLRIGGLIVNGSRKEVTPLIRQVSAGIGCLLWVGITYCYASSHVVSTWVAIYPLFAIGELINIKRAANDEREVRYGKGR